MPIEVIKSGAALGAEIRGVDLKRPIDDATFAEIHQAFLDNEVVYFRGQDLSDEDQIRFSRRLGRLRTMPLGTLDRQHPEILIVSNIVENGKHIGSYDAGIFWHTDGSFLVNPHTVTFLRAIEVPTDAGRVLGDTLFASMTAAYDTLDANTKQRIAGLQGVHSIKYRQEQTHKIGIPKHFEKSILNAPQAAHPIARVHPITGRKCLWISQGYTTHIPGLPEAESQALIKHLSHYCVEERFQYRHRWQRNDLVMWDNCATQHKATFDYKLPQRRLMHRTVVMDPRAAAESQRSGETVANFVSM